MSIRLRMSSPFSLSDFWSSSMATPTFLNSVSTSVDSLPESTYRSVGVVLSSWERIEFNLAQLYSSLVGLPNGEAIPQYGSERIYKLRADILKRAANNHFINYCNQELEAKFDQLCARCDDLAKLRNDVAHAIVMDVSQITYFRNTLNLGGSGAAFLLIPPLYLGSRHLNNGLPSFAYSSADLLSIASQMLGQEDEIKDFRLTYRGAP